MQSILPLLFFSQDREQAQTSRRLAQEHANDTMMPHNERDYFDANRLLVAIVLIGIASGPIYALRGAHRFLGDFLPKGYQCMLLACASVPFLPLFLPREYIDLITDSVELGTATFIFIVRAMSLLWCAGFIIWFISVLTKVMAMEFTMEEAERNMEKIVACLYISIGLILLHGLFWGAEWLFKYYVNRVGSSILAATTARTV
ncbi:uncharacterized protein EV422DRAFT_621508 [Fimicolochytrium jonesii]|uniref:uncharacterized protein n=1 Tax=Fimicolochytrium jonesii TaxID=1396493 RepID=UPI0022FDFE9D|nr:uncharacterized protein EV422DRAFT_621508 [Fimicolochytrium jonesii]KAI8819031.1 hypothetical protein EV422DRAFT_621508 [Fimicolochytrium jonesii]